MSLVSSKEMLIQAREGHYAVGAFNIENMEMAQAVIEAAKELHAPVIISTSESTLRYAEPKVFFHMVSALCVDTEIKVALHLDHGTSFKSVMQALRAGYLSVMIDGSKHTYKENLELTCRVIDICHEFQVSVEAELGAIVGKVNDAGSRTILTSPEMAMDFIERTHCDSLAIAIGTVHGFYKEEPKLDYERLAMINRQCNIPLVLHGASGLTETQLRMCIQNGINKINFATELRQIYTNTISAALQNASNNVDPKVYGRLARSSVKDLVKQKIILLGSANKN